MDGRRRRAWRKARVQIGPAIVSAIAILPAVCLLAQVGVATSVDGPVPSPQRGTGAAQPPTFRGGVDLVVVEATVLDRSGAVARGLGPADFKVEIGGDPRDVVSAELVEAVPAADSGLSDPEMTTNQPADQGRIVLLVVDQASLRSEQRSVLEAAKRWLATLPSADRVGLVVLPPPGPRVEFTTDRAPIVEALGRVSIVAIAPPPHRRYSVSLWEAIRITEGDGITYAEVVARECQRADPLCPDAIRTNARSMTLDAQSRVLPVLAALRPLLRALGVLPGPKHVVLVSTGWELDGRRAARELSPLAAEAALANATIHTFTAERETLSAAVSTPSPRIAMDRDMLASNVEMLSGMTGGRAARLTGDGRSAFTALSAGLAGYYRLAVRPAPGDLDGKPRRISVRLARQGVSLEGYRKILAATTTTGAASASTGATMPLRDALRTNAALTGVDLRATSYLLHGDAADGTLRIVVAAEVARAAAGPATAAAVLFDADGRPGPGTEVPVNVPASGRARLVTALAARPGTYVLRLAVADAGGRVGSLQRNVTARWAAVGALETTGLIALRQGQGHEVPEPLLGPISRTDTLVAQVSFSAPVSPGAATVRFDIRRDGVLEPLERVEGRLATTTAGATVARAVMPIVNLAPGRYTLAASIEPGGTEPFTRVLVVK